MYVHNGEFSTVMEFAVSFKICMSTCTPSGPGVLSFLLSSFFFFLLCVSRAKDSSKRIKGKGGEKQKARLTTFINTPCIKQHQANALLHDFHIY